MTPSPHVCTTPEPQDLLPEWDRFPNMVVRERPSSHKKLEDYYYWQAPR